MGSGEGMGLAAPLDWHGGLEVDGRLVLAGIAVAVVAPVLRRTTGCGTIDLEEHEYSSFRSESDE